MSRVRPMTRLDIALAVKEGKMKLDEVRPGIRRGVERLTQEFSRDDLRGYVAPTPAPDRQAGFIHAPVRQARTV